MAQQQPVERLSYTVEELRRATGFSRNKLYTAIARGELKSFKAGKRRMFSASAARAFIELLERRSAEGDAA
jgi:excisionase family DNA binding protein